jgi:hypothetical protein
MISLEWLMSMMTVLPLVYHQIEISDDTLYQRMHFTGP